MANEKFTLAHPAVRPALAPNEFHLARQEACAIYKSRGDTITIAEIDELAARHSKDLTHRIAIASSFHDHLVSFGTSSTPSPVNSKAPSNTPR